MLGGSYEAMEITIKAQELSADLPPVVDGFNV